ncbi:hypothetical protein BD769DRAFT_1670195 [Suillus cothurnatus]|nr:hypothetical protein BD769DRAFT_1670195 [Suillus cothurnatus]
MCEAMNSLLNHFAGRAAFILIDRVSRGEPQFHVVPSAHIRDSRTRSSFHEPALSVLIVTRDVCGHPASFARVVQSMAYDSAVHTVCAEGVALAESLASSARLYYSSTQSF